VELYGEADTLEGSQTDDPNFLRAQVVPTSELGLGSRGAISVGTNPIIVRSSECSELSAHIPVSADGEAAFTAGLSIDQGIIL